MTDQDPENIQTNTADSPVDRRGEQWVEAKADRPPTFDESARAEAAAADVDVDQVAEHYEEMAELGADVRGEGEIEPT